MPSPFPGMDPYLEGPIWHSFHYVLCVEIARQLTPKIGPRYIAFADVSMEVPIEDDWIGPYGYKRPDISVVREPAAPSYVSRKSGRSLRMHTPQDNGVTIRRVEIRDAPSMELITAIEVLSPGNKRGHGREKYLEKRRHMLRSEVNLIEIDLLRTGKRLPMQEEFPPDPYFVILHRAKERPAAEVWPIRLQDSLPSIPIPLLPEDQDSELDLQAAFSATFDVTPFDRAINYREPPEVRLTEKEAAWTHRLLREAGLRE